LLVFENTVSDSHSSTAPGPSRTWRPRRRQARGERRIAQLLDAAAEVLADAGYDSATTNAIAARAGVSTGTLYQFFPNKEAIAEALAERYREQLRAVAFTPDDASRPMDALLDRVVDPLVSFSAANPGFRALFAGPAPPQLLARAAEQLHAAMVQRMDGLLAALAPDLPLDRRQRSALVIVQVVKALVPAAAMADPAERGQLIGELKHVLRGYLTPLSSRH
jgi:AcrR family transcriptional regulator